MRASPSRDQRSRATRSRTRSRWPPTPPPRFSTVDFARALLDLRLATARQVSELADRLRRHEARLQQPSLGEPAQPGGVRDVGLAARRLLDVAGVHRQALELVFEDRPGCLPIGAGGLHHHLVDVVSRQPVAQPKQAADRGRELRDALLAVVAVVRDADARGDLRFVDVQRRRAVPGRPRTPDSEQAQGAKAKRTASQAMLASSPRSCACARPRQRTDELEGATRRGVVCASPHCHGSREAIASSPSAATRAGLQSAGSRTAGAITCARCRRLPGPVAARSRCAGSRRPCTRS